MFSSQNSQVSSAANYIEDVFSTYLYTGNGSTQTITNGIDLAGKGGLVWIKNRAVSNNAIFDTVRTRSKVIFTNTTAAEVTSGSTNDLTSFNNDGFSVGTTSNASVNTNAGIYASWTFREQPKFFDVVTYTGNGANRTIAHSLGSAPGSIWIKRTDTAGNWYVYHRGLNGGTTPELYMITLNTTNAQSSGATTYWNSTAPTSTEFYLGTNVNVNTSGGTYVAYLFAHDAGGFGLTGTDNVISCGSFTTDGSGNATVNLGYEPQWILSKASNAAFDWEIADVMRGMSVNTAANALYPNLSSAESTGYKRTPTATGFDVSGVAGAYTFIYIAIRRGPMKAPTSGTSVFGLNARTGTNVNVTVTGGQTDDAVLIKARDSSLGNLFASRLTGTQYLETSSTAAEVAAGTTILQSNPWDVMDGVKVGTNSSITNSSPTLYINYLFKRSPSFFDEVCYTANSSLNTNAPDSGLLVSHSLGVVPELIIIKDRIASAGTNANWAVWYTGLATQYPNGRHILLNSIAATVAATTNTFFNGTGPTSTQFRVWNNGNNATDGYVAYLFATCPGVSKVGSYTGTGTTKQVDCGFTAGARFVLIKRTDSTGGWYVWDSARGIVAGNDPYLLLNSTAAEVTNTDYVDTYSAGFEISSTAPAAINASGGSFIFLAIA